MNWYLSIALFSTVMWYLWVENFPLFSDGYSWRNWRHKTEKAALLLTIPLVCVVWGLAL